MGEDQAKRGTGDPSGEGDHGCLMPPKGQNKDKG